MSPVVTSLSFEDGLISISVVDELANAMSPETVKVPILLPGFRSSLIVNVFEFATSTFPEPDNAEIVWFTSTSKVPFAVTSVEVFKEPVNFNVPAEIVVMPL